MAGGAGRPVGRPAAVLLTGSFPPFPPHEATSTSFRLSSSSFRASQVACRIASLYGPRFFLLYLVCKTKHAELTSTSWNLFSFILSGTNQVKFPVQHLPFLYGSVYTTDCPHIKCIRLGFVRSSHLSFKMHKVQVSPY